MNGIPSSTFFSAPPDWGWLIVFYFFFGGLAGGCYFLASLIDVVGRPEDRPLARLGYYIAFPCVIVSTLLLILDLTRPLRFWHMLIESNTFRPMFKFWSPMSVGAWALLIFGIFALISFLAALDEDHRLDWPAVRKFRPPGILSKIIGGIGGLFGFYVAGYTGVLARGNQPPDLVGYAFVGHAVYRFGRIHIGGVNDPACAQIAIDHARLACVAPIGRVGDRLGIDRLDRRDDITRTRISRLGKRLGPAAFFRRHRLAC